MKPFSSIYNTTTTANNNSNIPSNLEDVSMDTASSTSISSSIPICSFDNTTLEQEADKQILEWASKLELETIELREKTVILIDIFNKKRDELNNCIKSLKNLLNGIDLQSITKISEELNALRNEQIRQFKDVTLKFTNIEEQITSFTKIIRSQQSQDKVDSMVTNQDKIILSSKNMEWICTNINDQLSQMTCFMFSISTELNNFGKRQMELEERVEQNNRNIISSTNLITTNDSDTAICLDCQAKRKQVTEQRFNMRMNGKVNGVQTPVPSQSQRTSISKETVASKPLDPITSITTLGPITRARSKRLRRELESRAITTTEISKKSPVNNNSNNDNNDGNRKRRRYNRTLIPWEDINKEEMTIQELNEK